MDNAKYPAEAVERLQDFQIGATEYAAIQRDDADLERILIYIESARVLMRESVEYLDRVSGVVFDEDCDVAHALIARLNKALEG